MNVLLWVLQSVLALLNLAGGAFKLFHYDELASVPSSAVLPKAGWGTVGVLEMACAVLLIVPAATKKKPVLTPIAAAILAVEGLALSANDARFSLELAATNPLVWSLPMAALAAFVAWGRFSLRPIR